MKDVKRTWCSDLGDGTYLNPVLYGEYPDPAVLKDGNDYYMINCFQPMVWHSGDLIHWEPYGEIPFPMGGAAGLSKVGDTYYVYNIDPFRRDEKNYRSTSIFLLTTQDLKNGPWEGPIYVGPAMNQEDGAELIDPDQLVDYEGRRWLFMSNNVVFPLSEDGRHLAGPGRRVLADEEFPDDWDIQGVYTEGPRFLKKDGWIYLIVAAGGTMGPATSHGVFAYRSKSALGPWERSPYNPIIRTKSRKEKWLSKGHGTLIEAPDGAWYMMYHAFLKDRYNHGRMALMEPVEWTDDGWFRIPEDSDPAKPLPAPKGGFKVPHGFPTQIDFPQKPSEVLPAQWMYRGGVEERIESVEDGLRVRAAGTNFHDCGAIVYQGVFENSEIITHVTVNPGAGAGLGMYYSPLHSVGFALREGYLWVFNCGHHNLTRLYNGKPYLWDEIWLRLTVRDQVVSCWFNSDGGDKWEKLPTSFNISHISVQAFLPRDTSGMTMYPALYTYGTGDAIYHSFTIRPLDVK